MNVIFLTLRLKIKELHFGFKSSTLFSKIFVLQLLLFKLVDVSN